MVIRYKPRIQHSHQLNFFYYRQSVNNIKQFSCEILFKPATDNAEQIKLRPESYVMPILE
ncbi:hypothetical protein ACBO_12830 [Acinetobacter bouvetii]|nr:hypothetical protein ACBO_12830 [Acinetobacter bouvetii]